MFIKNWSLQLLLTRSAIDFLWPFSIGHYFLDKLFDPSLGADSAGVYATGKRYFIASRLVCFGNGLES